MNDVVEDDEGDEESAVVVDITKEEPIKYITCNWCHRVYVDLRLFANHCKTAHEKSKFTNADFSYLGRQYPDEVPIESAMEVEVVTTVDADENSMDQDDVLILSPNDEERRQMKELLEATKHEKDDENKAFKRRVKEKEIKFRIHYDKNRNRKTHDEAMVDHMHQGGDMARKGAIESRERAKNQKENPQPIKEYTLLERNMKHNDISLEQDMPNTITRSHPMIMKDILEARPLRGKSAKEVKKALIQKNDLVKSLVQTNMGPRGPVVLTVGAARVTKDAEEQRHQGGQQNAGSSGQTSRTPQSTPTRRTIARPSNASNASTVQAGSQSARNDEGYNFNTAPSTPARRQVQQLQESDRQLRQPQG